MNDYNESAEFLHQRQRDRQAAYQKREQYRQAAMQTIGINTNFTLF